MLAGNDKTIVIVTYDLERYFLELQIKSINKYLEPCEIIIIYCDKNLQYNEWLTWAQKCIVPVVPNHTVHLYDCNYFYQASTVKNWRNFAYALKLFASLVVSSDCYWSLDSKNFFFKPTIFTKLLEQYPINLVNTDFEEGLKKIHSYYGITNTYFKINTTPFKFNVEICKLMIEKGINFTDSNVSYAEIFYHQAFCYKNGIEMTSGDCIVNNSTVFPGHYYSGKQLVAYMKSKDPAVRCTGIHTDVAKKLDKNTFDAVIAYVGGKDLIPITTRWIFN
jgi:hypothetical protein